MENGVEQAPLDSVKLRKAENKFKPDLKDFVFALVTFVLGYIFTQWVLFAKWQGWGVGAFTSVYLLGVTIYLIKKDVFVNSISSWFWLMVTLVVSVSFVLWENVGVAGIRAVLLFCATAYYVIIASGSAIMGKTGNFLLIDSINATIIIPFGNFLNQYLSFSVLGKGDKWREKILSIALGVLFIVLLGSILIPMLERADSGGFVAILSFFKDIFSSIVVDLLVTIPIAAYMYGLVSGVAHKRCTDAVSIESVQKAVADLI